MFKIDGLDEPDGKIHEYASRDFKCSEKKGSFPALLAIMMHSIFILIEFQNRDALRKKIENALKFVHKNCADLDLDEPVHEEEDKDEDEPNSKRQKITKSASRNHGKANLSSNQATDNSSTTTFGSQGSSEAIHVSEQDRSPEPNTYMEKIRSLAQDCLVQVGEGSSGSICSYFFSGKRVALKRWNGISSEGLEQLINEMAVYKMLFKEDARVLGDAVPQLFGLVNERTEDAVLAMEYVRNAIV